MHLPVILRPPRALRRPARWGALAAGAGLALLIFPAPGLSVLAWFSLVPGLMVIRAAPTAREAGVRAWWLSCGYAGAAMYWLAPEIGPGVVLIGAVQSVPVGAQLHVLRGRVAAIQRQRPHNAQAPQIDRDHPPAELAAGVHVAPVRREVGVVHTGTLRHR